MLGNLLILKTKNSKTCYEQTFEHEFLVKAKKVIEATLISTSASTKFSDVKQNF